MIRFICISSGNWPILLANPRRIGTRIGNLCLWLDCYRNLIIVIWFRCHRSALPRSGNGADDGGEIAQRRYGRHPQASGRGSARGWGQHRGHSLEQHLLSSRRTVNSQLAIASSFRRSRPQGAWPDCRAGRGFDLGSCHAPPICSSWIVNRNCRVASDGDGERRRGFDVGVELTPPTAFPPQTQNIIDNNNYNNINLIHNY